MCGICVSTWPMLESLAVSLQSCCWLPQKRGDLGRCFFQRPEQSPPTGCQPRHRSSPSPMLGVLPRGPSQLFCLQNWFRTSADPPPKHRIQASLVPKKEEKKSLSGGKKRGRKPKERPPEEPTLKMPPRRDDWPPGGRDKGARGSASRKVGASRAAEK